ncbi:hypothetical protein ACFOGJ_29305 [Marinibaculum pumilum]|uniref:Uncharacterized protein n=1 Tax=Marinibaculum pumilum TaxID=1766165 RepID=A0ABV7LAD8_9PROT
MQDEPSTDLTPDPVVGPDFRLTFQLAPGGLANAVMARVEGRFTGAALVAAYRVLVRYADGPVLSVIADTRGTETLLDFAAYRTATGVMTAHGIARLNLVVCERDVGRQFLVRFGNEVAQLGGLTVRSRIVADIDAAAETLAQLIAEPD